MLLLLIIYFVHDGYYSQLLRDIGSEEFSTYAPLNLQMDPSTPRATSLFSSSKIINELVRVVINLTSMMSPLPGSGKNGRC